MLVRLGVKRLLPASLSVRHRCFKWGLDHAQYDEAVVTKVIRQADAMSMANWVELVDCRELHDPATAKIGTKHSGWHVENLKPISEHRAFPDVMKDVAQKLKHCMVEYRESPVTIALVCKSGRHRSKACAGVLVSVFRRELASSVEFVGPIVLTRHVKPKCHGCMGCEWFPRHAVPAREPILKEAMAHFMKAYDA